MPVENSDKRIVKDKFFRSSLIFQLKNFVRHKKLFSLLGFICYLLSLLCPSQCLKWDVNECRCAFFFMEIMQFLAQRIRPSFSSSEFSLEAMAQLCMQSTDSKIQALVMFILHHVQAKLFDKCCFINTSPYSCLDLHVVSFLIFLPVPLHPK